jgi:hypothetical protein
MVNMNRFEFYRYYIPALIKALINENDWEQFNVKGPEHFLNVSDEKQKEIEIYLDQIAGQDKFLDSIAYYFDAKSHGFNEIDGVKIEEFRRSLENEILKCKKKHGIE